MATTKKAILESECLAQAKELGQPPESAQRICDSISSDANDEALKLLDQSDDMDDEDTLDNEADDLTSNINNKMNPQYASVSPTRQAETTEVQPFESNGRFFVKAFLLDTSVNLNNWGVAPHTLDANITSYIGKPIVLTDNFDHPDSGDDNLDHALLYQELYRIGTVIDVVKNGSRYDAIAEITDPYAIDAWKQGELPIYVSPQLYKQDPLEPDSSISRWGGTHLALVKDPAFGVKVASYKGTCTGEEDKCLAFLKKASIVKQHGYGSCGYCNRKVLLSAMATLHEESKVNEPISSQIASLPENSSNSLPENKEESHKPNHAEVLEAAQKEVEKLKTKLAIAERSNEEHKQVNEDLGKRIASLETESRKDKISSILSAAEYDKETFTAKVESLAKSNLPIDDIHGIFKPLVEAKLKSASVAPTVKAAEPVYVESKVSLKNAATEVEAPRNAKPAWLANREHLLGAIR